MPMMKCQMNGKPGIKWGEHGKCYTGPDKEAKASDQRAAIEASKARRGRGFESAMKK